VLGVEMNFSSPAYLFSLQKAKALWRMERCVEPAKEGEREREGGRIKDPSRVRSGEGLMVMHGYGPSALRGDKFMIMVRELKGCPLL
jgi:hypothetical protein